MSTSIIKLREASTNGPVIHCLVLQLLSVFVLLGPATAYADDPKPDQTKPAEPQPAETSPVFEITISPAAEPVPALRYRLLPAEESRLHGNAVPIYLRLVHEQNDEWKQRLNKASDLLNFPLEKLPLEETKKLLSDYEYVTEQLFAAAKRDRAEWEYVMEDADPIDIRLPDAQYMRTYARLLSLKARYEVRTAHVQDALATIGTGLALGRHAGKGPFLVNQLIGMAINAMLLAQVDELTQQPDAPNLYWALAALPRPMVSFEPGNDVEARFLELRFPELRELDHPRSEAEWQKLAKEMREWALVVIGYESTGKEADMASIRRPAKPEKLAEARQYLIEVLKQPADTIKSMSDAEVEVRYTAGLHRVVTDGWRKWCYLPFSQSVPKFRERSEKLSDEVRKLEIYPLVSMIAPVGGNLLVAASRNERMVARLMVIEALRMHAVATGKLPQTLAEVTVVPVPLDPCTGAPFLYELTGDTATLDAVEEQPDLRQALRMPVKIRLRGK